MFHANQGLAIDTSEPDLNTLITRLEKDRSVCVAFTKDPLELSFHAYTIDLCGIREDVRFARTSLDKFFQNEEPVLHTLRVTTNEMKVLERWDLLPVK
jgi:hypothetical protein